MTPISGKAFVVLQNCDHISPNLFALQGISGKTYGTAQYERPKGGHRITLPLEEFLAAAEDIARASTRPMSFWRVAEILVDADESSDGKLAAALEEAQAQIAQLTLERDAAIRAIGSTPVGEAHPATEAAAEPLPAAELPPLPSPSSRREYLESVPQFRTLRREAKDAGVAGVETFTERGPLIAAILAAEATAPAPVTDEAEQNG